MMPAERPFPATAELAVVGLPDEVDITNADGIGASLLAAFTPGVTIVVADMTNTTFCDSRGIRALVLAHEHAVASGCELRLAVPCARVLRTLAVLGLHGWLNIYRCLQEASAAPGSAEE